MKLFKLGDVVNVFVPPRTVRRYRVRLDGSFAEIDPEPQPLKTIDPEKLKSDIERMGWGYDL